MNRKPNKRVPTPEKGTVRLCGVQGCCPTVNFDDPNWVILTDDYNGTVKLTREQWDELKCKFSAK